MIYVTKDKIEGIGTGPRETADHCPPADKTPPVGFAT